MKLPRLRIVFAPSLFIFLSFLSHTACAGLIDRGNGLIYDNVLDITWLQDGNYALSSGYAAANARESTDVFAQDNIFADGRMGQAAALQWAADLVYAGYDDWRLPTVTPINGIQFLDFVPGAPFSIDGTADLGFGIPGIGWVNNVGSPASEMGHMFYVNLGNIAICDPNNPIGTNFNENLNACRAMPVPGSGLTNPGPFMNVETLQSYWTDKDFPTFPESGITFDFNTGIQRTNFWDEEAFAWAVRDGDVASVLVVPEPSSMSLAFVALLGFRNIRRINKKT